MLTKKRVFGIVYYGLVKNQNQKQKKRYVRWVAIYLNSRHNFFQNFKLTRVDETFTERDVCNHTFSGCTASS